MIGERKIPGEARRTEAELAAHAGAALQELVLAWDCAREVQAAPWEFAVEIGELAALGLGRSGLRWLMKMGYAEHAREITRSRDSVRRFQPELSLAFTSRTCFILTEAGHSWLAVKNSAPAILRLHEESAATPVVAASRPHWDRRTRTLCLGERIVKRYRVPAENQEAVLSAFEQEAWVQAIDDPLPFAAEVCPGVRLRDTLRRLNASQANRLLHFFGDGTGKRVLWEMLRPADADRQPVRRVG